MPEIVNSVRPWSAWTAFRTAAWLGWQIESNWARPWVFAIYAVLKPLALSGILVVMYAALNRGGFASPAFAFMYVGNAFYMYVGAVMSGMGFAVVQDREHYRTLKSMYAAPMDVRLYLVGRGVARFAMVSFSVLLTLLVGVFALGLRIVPSEVNWLLLVTSLVLGIAILACMGIAMAGVMLTAGQQAWGVGELVAGALYLFSGAIFPLDVLPAVLRPLGLALPLAYWLELVRRALIGGEVHAYAAFAGWSDGRLVAVLAGATVVLAVVSLVVFAACDTHARRRGLIDRTSNY
jgi:ABC-2 type transport system permease protein